MASQSITVKAWENQLFVSVIGKVFQELVAFRVDRGIVWTTGNDDPGLFRINIAGLSPLGFAEFSQQLGVKPLAMGLERSPADSSCLDSDPLANSAGFLSRARFLRAAS